MTKFEHTIFALPFAYLGMVMGCRGGPTLEQFVWVTLAMVGARSFAMGWNRYADRDLDRRNPRTSAWPLPQGKISARETLAFIFFSLVLFVLAAYQLAPLCRLLWPIVLLPLAIYSFAKRFTWFSHFILGTCLGLAPIGAWVAVTNRLPEVGIILLGFGVLFWTAGFDIIYSCQDYHFDRRERLHSIPVQFGMARALRLAKWLHILTIVFFVAFGMSYRLNVVYFTGLVLCSLFMWYEHRVVKPNDLSRINLAFFQLNGIVSVVAFVCASVDISLFGLF
jgi:4-hydroxybenzoate polyprenyltransferase